ncbi:hypothetical protein AB0I68_30050 [Streptomyces sp. NPDC050448]|uniref:hypothetical protein n=1 Tax=Streptomyces sp. NPDC050448 TaxID=3155404 RepID=UPI003413BE44
MEGNLAWGNAAAFPETGNNVPRSYASKALSCGFRVFIKPPEGEHAVRSWTRERGEVEGR